MDFSIPERTMRDTGPVTLTFTVNGKLLDRLRVEQAGEHHYAHDVPRGNTARQRDQPGGHRSRPGVDFQRRWRQARVHPLERRVYGVAFGATGDSLRRRVHMRGQPRAGRADVGRCVPRSGRPVRQRRVVAQPAGMRAVQRRTGVPAGISGTGAPCWPANYGCSVSGQAAAIHQEKGFRPTRPCESCGESLFGMYVVLYLSNAMAPEASPDGAGYHLGLVARYLREHGFVRITDNLYAAMPAGVEMLFLFAFAFGRHSAAAMVHFAFLVALAWQVFSYGRRSGFPVPGAVRRTPRVCQSGGGHRRHERI